NATIPSTTTTSTTNANLTPIYPLTTQSTTQYYQRNFASTAAAATASTNAAPAPTTGNTISNSIQETRSYVPTILPKNATIPSTTTTSTTNANLTPIYPLTTQNYQDHYNQSSTTTTTNSLQMSNNSNNTSLNEEDQEDESESGESESDENEEEEGSGVEEEGWISPKQVLAPNGKYLIIKYDEVETEQSGSEKEVDDEDLSVLESDEGIHSGSRRWSNVELTILLKYIFRRINTRKLYHDLGLKKSSRAMSLKKSYIKRRVQELFEVDW
ncbi:3693_t:CDS:2, partial [Entrophospora sp. SA101]